MQMSSDKLTIESLLAKDNFVPLGKKAVSHIPSLEEICENLHHNDPVKTLKSFSLLPEERGCNALEYANKYQINSDKKRGEFLISLIYSLKKQVDEHNTITITDKDINFNVPLYYLSISQNEIITDYSVKLTQCDLIPKFRDGYIHDDNQYVYDIFSRNKSILFRKLLRDDSQLIFNNYNDKIVITFNERYSGQEMNIEVKLYNIYAYGGFFNSGWIFS